MKIDEDQIVLDGVTYLRLYAKCPVCRYLGLDTPPTFWYHKQCGGEVYIGNNAKFFCKECGQSSHVSKTKFSCPNHCECEEETIEFSIIEENSPSFCPGSIVSLAGITWLREFLDHYNS